VNLQRTPAPLTDIEIGWHFERSSWGRGYATEAAAALLLHAFVTGVDRVVADIVPDNRRSRAVAKRLGVHRIDVVERSDLLHGVAHQYIERRSMNRAQSYPVLSNNARKRPGSGTRALSLPQLEGVGPV
jgi:RimJ/RimL family protein N-acetyltransferase